MADNTAYTQLAGRWFSYPRGCSGFDEIHYIEFGKGHMQELPYGELVSGINQSVRLLCNFTYKLSELKEGLDSAETGGKLVCTYNAHFEYHDTSDDEGYYQRNPSCPSKDLVMKLVIGEFHIGCVYGGSECKTKKLVFSTDPFPDDGDAYSIPFKGVTVFYHR